MKNPNAKTRYHRLAAVFCAVLFLTSLIPISNIPVAADGPLAWDMLDEPWESLGSWTKGGTGTSTISDGLLRNCPSDTGGYVGRWIDVGSLPASGYTVEASAYIASFGAGAGDGYLCFDILDGMHASTMSIYSNKVTGRNNQEFNLATSTAWYTWRFVIDSDADLIKIYRNSTYVGQFTSLYDHTIDDGYVSVWAVNPSGYTGADTHTDYLKIATGLYPPDQTGAYDVFANSTGINASTNVTVDDGIKLQDRNLIQSFGDPFEDESTSSHTITPYGNAKTSTSQPKFGDSSAYFDGSGDCLSIPDSNDWNFGDGNFTIDFWVNFESLPSSFAKFYRQSGGGFSYFALQKETGVYYLISNTYSDSTGNIYVKTAWTPTLGTQYHIALVRYGNYWATYINGTLLGSKTQQTTYPNLSGSFYISADDGTGDFFNGYMDEFRISKDIARWTSDFTPPSSSNVTDSYTKLLLHFDNPFKDDSANSYAVTPYGDAKISTTQSKFGGSSAYFDGNGDYLDCGSDSSLKPSSLTLEAWIKTNSASTQVIISNYEQEGSAWKYGYALSVNSNGKAEFFIGGNTEYVGIVGTTTINDGNWHHVAGTFAPNDQRLYVDGNQENSSTTVDSIEYFSGVPTRIGRINDDSGSYVGTLYFNGYMDEIRVSNCTRWTSNFTPPSSSNITDSYTKLLLRFDNDNEAIGNDPEGWVVSGETGNAYIDVQSGGVTGNCVRLYGTNSDGSWAAATRYFEKQRGKVTWEFSAKTTQSKGGLFYIGGNGSVAAIYFYNSGLYYHSGTDWTYIMGVSTNTWYRISIEADVNLSTYNLYVDGVSRLENKPFISDGDNYINWIVCVAYGYSYTSYVDNITVHDGTSILTSYTTTANIYSNVLDAQTNGIIEFNANTPLSTTFEVDLLDSSNNTIHSKVEYGENISTLTSAFQVKLKGTFNTSNTEFSPVLYSWGIYDDMDGDGMPDYWEDMYGLNKSSTSDKTTDADSDNLNNLAEYRNRTNPLCNDTDFDDLTDYYEINTLGTKPYLADTDFDGMPDGWENTYGLNASNDKDLYLDPDNDGYDYKFNGTLDGIQKNETFTNVQEYYAGTNPQDSDTDNDGINDGWEDHYGINPNSVDTYRPDCYDDLDNDSVTNLAEYQAHTNPETNNTDGDSRTDFQEVFIYPTTDPNDYSESTISAINANIADKPDYNRQVIAFKQTINHTLLSENNVEIFYEFATTPTVVAAFNETVKAILSAHPDVAYILDDRNQKDSARDGTREDVNIADEVSKLKTDVYDEKNGTKVQKQENVKGRDNLEKTSDQIISWGFESIGLDEKTRQKYGGKGITIAVLDTGIDYTHPDLTGQVLGGTSFINEDTGTYADYYDLNGHGTHVAGIIAAKDNDFGIVGVAPNAKLYAVKVLDKNGIGYASTIAAGIDWAIAHNVDIISMSLGSNLDSRIVEEMCFEAYKKGIILVAAAGVDGRGTSVWTVDYPAQYTSVISVAAYDNKLEHPFWSSNGPANELAAPGVDILSTWTGGGYTKLSGTSMSTPYVTGMVALLMEKEHYDALETSARKDKKNHLSPDTIRGVFQATAHDLGSVGKDELFGFGSVYTDALFYDKPAENYFIVEFLGYGTDDDVPFGIRNTNLVEDAIIGVDTINVYRLQVNITDVTERYIVADYIYKNHDAGLGNNSGILNYVQSIGIYLPGRTTPPEPSYWCWWDGTSIFVDNGSVNGVSTNWVQFDPYAINSTRNGMPNLDSVAVNSTVHMRVVAKVGDNHVDKFNDLSIGSNGIILRKEYWCKQGYDMSPTSGSGCYWYKEGAYDQWKTDMGTSGSTQYAMYNTFNVATLNYWSNNGVNLSTPMDILLHLNASTNDTDGDGLSDFDEVNGTWGFSSEPALYDTNGNGVNDGNERIKAIIDNISQTELENHVKLLSGETGNVYTGRYGGSYSTATRLVGTEGCDEASKYIAEQFYNISILSGSRLVPGGNSACTDFNQSFSVTYYTWFDYPNYWYPHGYSTTLKNVIAKINGTDQNAGVYIISAHYDSINYENWSYANNNYTTGSAENVYAPGANDDASGVAALIEMARVIATKKFKATIIFIAFSGEETLGYLTSLTPSESQSDTDGYMGSRYFVKNLSSADRNKIKGVINLDMILLNGTSEVPPGTDWYGQPSYENGPNTIMVRVNNYTTGQYAEKLKDTITWGSADYLGINGLSISLNYAHRESDYRSFWDYNIIALGVNDILSNDDGYYNIKHTHNDTTDLVYWGGKYGSRDFGMALRTTRACLGRILIDASITW